MKLRALSIAASLVAVMCQRQVETPTASDSAPKLAAAAKEVLPFIQDDYPRALAEAKQRNVPLFVEAWAPW